MKNLFKNLIIIFTILLSLFFNYTLCYAAKIINTETRAGMEASTDEFLKGSGFQKSTSGSGIADMTATVIKAFLGLLGIIFVVLMLNAGFKWMTAQGEEEKVRKAKDEITRAIIGIIIIIFSYAITYFVFRALDNAVSATNG